jgi:RNA polymerase sigma factor (sigma-70 family)
MPTDAAPAVTPLQLRDAERTFRLMLRKFPPVWVAENASDLLAQANVEYAEWLRDRPPARNPVGWLLTCAYRRALNLWDKQRRRPASAPLDHVFHLADKSTLTPEEQVLDRDLRERLRAALEHLPDKERKLLELVYYGGFSVREAGRKLGWQKSAADRHHRAALAKLEAFVGDRSPSAQRPPD